MIVRNQGDNVELKDVKLKKLDGRGYFLDVTFKYENETGVYEMNIPLVKLPIKHDELPIFMMHMDNGDNKRYIDLGFGELPMLFDTENLMTHSITKIKDKPRKMTLSEIEKALGYEIELVK